MARRSVIRICTSCGAEFTGNARQFQCDACSAAGKKNSSIRMRTCQDCGIEFLGGPRAKRCPACRIRAERERAARYRKNGYARKLGSTDTCERCGREYTVSNGRQRYCPDCRYDAVMAVDRSQGAAYYTANRDKIAEIRSGKRVSLKRCVICDFNPRSPCGERLAPPDHVRQRLQFSIHAPRAGSDACRQNTLPLG